MAERHPPGTPIPKKKKKKKSKSKSIARVLDALARVLKASMWAAIIVVSVCVTTVVLFQPETALTLATTVADVWSDKE